ncbi:hypothetical protein THAOC_00659 [Thalassiosira oceanica]|uniref:PDEase domain-containing protein n=1 Tax=Thalassiosira oceanica TaxID=159749 RepID=K0TNY7_THAOC|nr:hypothetical protein THAOC_00659 [Thalassiosira oceanica]|eukprot:EJK77506.1 hypothetical protein THAOC_00659 [Thalassiosira oceanica]
MMETGDVKIDQGDCNCSGPAEVHGDLSEDDVPPLRQRRGGTFRRVSFMPNASSLGSPNTNQRRGGILPSSVDSKGSSHEDLGEVEDGGFEAPSGDFAVFPKKVGRFRKRAAALTNITKGILQMRSSDDQTSVLKGFAATSERMKRTTAISNAGSKAVPSATSKSVGSHRALSSTWNGSDGDHSSNRPDFRSKSVSVRRDNIDHHSLTMGLDEESANFLDFMAVEKCNDWLKSLSRRDPRACIKAFFDDVARDGADNIEEENGFQPELLSPLISMFQRSSIFSVWRPTSIDSIRKMMTGQGTGKGLDIKGKSAKKGKLSAYVPFLQIHEEQHKDKIRALPRYERIRIFYKKREARDAALKILNNVLDDMTARTKVATEALLGSDKLKADGPAAQDGSSAERVLSLFQSLGINGDLTEDEMSYMDIIQRWDMEDARMIVLDDYSPASFGIDMPKRLFWEGYIMRAKDISRVPDTEFDTGRPSRPSYQDMNFASIKNECDEESPRTVVWQYTDPYLPPNEPDPCPMLPQTLLMAYEENGRVMPVVSDFDCLLLGTRGVRFHNPLPNEQVDLIHDMVNDIEKILRDCTEGKANNWTSSWLNVMKHHARQITMPRYGFGDPKSYAIMKHAVKRLEEFGAVRHGAECFNYYFPQELDDEFLVIGGNLGGRKYKYMKLSDLQEFLYGCIDLGFTFPLNPKWVLCDKGWKVIYDKLTASSHPNVQLSIKAWYGPADSALRTRIEGIHQRYPGGFQSDLSARKKGTQAWDEAEIALDKYQRIQRAKTKLWCVLVFLSIVERSRQKVRVQARKTSDVSKNLNYSRPAKIGSGDTSRPANRTSTRVSFLDEEYASSSMPDDARARANRCSDLLRSRTIPDRALCGGALRGNSSSMSTIEDDENVDVVDSLLSDGRHGLTDFQARGLRRIRKILVDEQSQPQLAPQNLRSRFERRHTTSNVRLSPLILEDAPSFILTEYGGPYDRNDTFLPIEWTRLDEDTRISLSSKLSFSALSSWEFNIVDVARECKIAPMLFIGWAIIGSPHAQKAMARYVLTELSFAILSTVIYLSWCRRDLGLDISTQSGGYDFTNKFAIQLPILCSFLRTVEADYEPNPYHNSSHAADVVQTLNAMLQLGGKQYAHPGLNNNYQVNSRSELAVQYNDVSVLENYSVTWQVLFSKLLGQTRDFTVDVFSGLTKEQFRRARSVIIRSVLETDMTHHFALLKKMGVHQQMLKGKPSETWLESYTNEGVNYDPSLDMLCFLLHQADISNPAKPAPLFEYWADRILQESFIQGDKEASLSLPISPLCDRETTDKRQSQVGFIKFVVQPSYQILGDLLPRFATTVFPYIDSALEYWEDN